MAGGVDDVGNPDAPRPEPPAIQNRRDVRRETWRGRWGSAPTTVRVTVVCQLIEFAGAAAAAATCFVIGAVLIIAASSGSAASHAVDFRGLAAFGFFFAGVSLVVLASVVLFCATGVLRRSRAWWFTSICLLVIVSYWWATASATIRLACWTITVPQLCLLLWPASIRYLQQPSSRSARSDHVSDDSV